MRFTREGLAVLLMAMPAAMPGEDTKANHPKRMEPMRFIATAHAQEGTTASGTESRFGTVAADPSVLPMGTVIQVTKAGSYSGVYRVEDTGAKVKGRRIDIYVGSVREARRFGVRRVQVRVLEWGDWPKPGAARSSDVSEPDPL